MSRAIVLVLCLTSAAGVAVYTHYNSREPSEQVAVFTVPQRVEVPAARPRSSGFSSDKAGLARTIRSIRLTGIRCAGLATTQAWSKKTP
jgi:hypothetical protein